jgi:creatinine amidohydrolase
MKPPASRYWIDLATSDFAGIDRARLVALLPLGATEQHGPHLPLSVDSRICAALVKRVVDRAPAALPLSILPMLHVGVSPEHADFPGTLTLSAETMIAVLAEIGASVAAAGVKKLAFVNAHGGQPQVLDIVAQRLRREAGLLVFPLNAYRYFQPEDALPAEETQHGIHGGAVETSLMLAIAPEAVRRQAARPFPSLSADMARRFKHLRPFGRVAGFGWQAQDLNPAGAVGDPTLASAAIGEKLLDRAAGTLLAVLGEIDALDPAVLKPAP